MPNDSSLKKDMVILETGRPFRPAMFEGVLKFFTPDVPSSISGRPRCVRVLFQCLFLYCIAFHIQRLVWTKLSISNFWRDDLD